VGWAGNKEPWEYGDEFTRINRAYIELRYKFLPYFYSLFYEHERTGQPVMRPLWYEFPADKSTYLIGDEYMAGGDVLVAPVVKEGMRNRDVYLPAGSAWVNWWTGERFEGGRQINVQAPLDRLPLFVRAGAIIATQDVIQHTGQMPDASITLNVAAGIEPGKVEVAKIHEDAGDGYDYRKSGWREIRIEHGQGMLKISRTGDFKGQRIGFLEVVGLASDPKEIRADGKKIDHTYDAETKRARVELPEGAHEIKLIR
jgi:alpha-glucosidase